MCVYIYIFTHTCVYIYIFTAFLYVEKSAMERVRWSIINASSWLYHWKTQSRPGCLSSPQCCPPSLCWWPGANWISAASPLKSTVLDIGRKRGGRAGDLMVEGLISGTVPVELSAERDLTPSCVLQLLVTLSCWLGCSAVRFTALPKS